MFTMAFGEVYPYTANRCSAPGGGGTKLTIVADTVVSPPSTGPIVAADIGEEDITDITIIKVITVINFT